MGTRRWGNQYGRGILSESAPTLKTDDDAARNPRGRIKELQLEVRRFLLCHVKARSNAKSREDFFRAMSRLKCKTMRVCVFAPNKRCVSRTSIFWFLLTIDFASAAARESRSRPVQAEEGDFGLPLAALRRGLFALDLQQHLGRGQQRCASAAYCRFQRLEQPRAFPASHDEPVRCIGGLGGWSIPGGDGRCIDGRRFSAGRVCIRKWRRGVCIRKWRRGVCIHEWRHVLAGGGVGGVKHASSLDESAPTNVVNAFYPC